MKLEIPRCVTVFRYFRDDGIYIEFLFWYSFGVIFGCFFFVLFLSDAEVFGVMFKYL